MNSPFRGLRRAGNQSYPYPRTHTPVMVFRNNVRSVVIQNSPESSPNSLSRITVMSPEDIKKNYVPKRRPPLNWAIPTIPESLSDESLKSILSQRNDEMGNFIIDRNLNQIDVSKLVEAIKADKNVINKETNDAIVCELNEYDKKNNNFVDKFKIRKYWKKHQKNKSIEEKDEKDKGNTQIPRLKMKNILKKNVKEKDNLHKHNINIDSSERLTSQKIFLEKKPSLSNYSNSILGKSPLITMAQKFRNRNRKSKDPAQNSSTNVNGSTSMDFMKQMFPQNLCQYTESLKRSQSLEAKTGQLSELFSKTTQQTRRNDSLEAVEEGRIDGDYFCIYTTTKTEGESESVQQEDTQSNNLSLTKENSPLKVNTSFLTIDEEKSPKNSVKSHSENLNNSENNSDKQKSPSLESTDQLHQDIQESTRKQTNKLTFKSFFNSKIIKPEKTKGSSRKSSKETNLPSNLISTNKRTLSLAELESKLYLQNPLNRPLVVPNDFGKSFDSDANVPLPDENLLSCTETYAPLYFQVQKVIGQESKNNDDLCPLLIPKNLSNEEKLPIVIKDLYCKPYTPDLSEPPENIQQCKEYDEYCVEQVKKYLSDHEITEKILKEKEEALEKAIQVIENSLKNMDFDDNQCLKDAVNCIMTMSNDESTNLPSQLNNSPFGTENNINQKNEKSNRKKFFNDEFFKNCFEEEKNIATNDTNGSNSDHDCINSSYDNLSNEKLSNDAISFASVNTLTSGSSDIVVETSPEGCENLQNSPTSLKYLPNEEFNSIDNKNSYQLCDSDMLIESTVIDNIAPPKFIKSTYIPMIEDYIDGDSDIIEDKICKSGDGFKLDIQFSPNNIQNNEGNCEKSKKDSLDTLDQLVNISPYESMPIKENFDKNCSTPFKLKSNTSRLSGRQIFSFFSKGRKKHKKIKEKLGEDKVRKAPLAQSECTRIANSPMIETPPISLIQKNCKTITDDVISGVPAVVNEEEYLTPKTPRSRANVESSAGLIDDDINDQPMLIGNSYSMNNLGSLTSFQVDHFDVEEEYKNDSMSKSTSGVLKNTSSNELCIIGNKGMAKSITDALIASNLKNEPIFDIISSGSINTIPSEKNTFHSIAQTYSITDDEKSNTSFNSSKENQIFKNTNEEHILKCTENEELRIDTKLVEFENQPFDFGIHTCQQKLNFSNKPYEPLNCHPLIKQLKQENKKLHEIIRKKDDEIKLLKEKLSIFVNL